MYEQAKQSKAEHGNKSISKDSIRIALWLYSILKYIRVGHVTWVYPICGPPLFLLFLVERLTDSLDHPCHAAFSFLFFFWVVGLLSSSTFLLSIAGLGVHRLCFKTQQNIPSKFDFSVDAAPVWVHYSSCLPSSCLGRYLAKYLLG